MTTFLGTKLAKIHFTSHFSEYYCIFARIKNKESHRTMEKAKQIPYRAIALDLDGTLTNHEKVVTPKTREALLQASAKGAVIILASGRPTYGIEPVAECLELNKQGGYILSYNGGNIVNAKTGEKLFSQFLPDEVIPELYAYAEENGHALLGYAGNEIITEMPDDQYVKEESRINKMNIRKVRSSDRKSVV